MATYNCAPTIDEAVNSIVAQTHSSWELVICDDASTDGTYEALEQLAARHSGRIKLLRNAENRKLPYSLNKCLEVSVGELIARMDGDDLSQPQRFARQMQYLEDHPEIDMVGSSMRRFDKEGLSDVLHPPEHPDRETLRRDVPFCHATIMARRHVFEALNGYVVAPRTVRSQDIDLWFRFFHLGFRGDNILEPLYLVREDLDAVRRRTIKSRFYVFQTTIKGFSLLDYPKTWYWRPTLLLVKSLVPARGVMMFRRWQGHRFRSKHFSGLEGPL